LIVSRVVRLLAAPVVVLLATAGCGASARAPKADSSYGSLPTFLPTSTVEPDSILVGTIARPALTSQGDAVEVQLASADVRAMVAGPEVPGEGLPYQTPATTCTWTITLSGATSAVSIAPSQFSTLDHLGAVYHPAFVPGQPVPPAVLPPGQSTTFELRVVMPVGEGLMRWAPDGAHILASWDFEVEND
jgi:hypothetical protein